MDIRYSAHPNDVKRFTTEELRREFLIENLYQPDQVAAVYSHVDRMVILGCMPVSETVSIDKGIDVWANFGTHYFLERREIGMFNIGGDGSVTVAIRPACSRSPTRLKSLWETPPLPTSGSSTSSAASGRAPPAALRPSHGRREPDLRQHRHNSHYPAEINWER